MNQHYNQNYSKKQIEKVLTKLKDCIYYNKYTISINRNRQENTDFIYEYNIRKDKQRKILMRLCIADFCYTMQNKKAGFEDEVLYIFVPQVQLNLANGVEVTVDTYIKFNIIDLSNGAQTIIISFHKRNKPIAYLFR